jgi:hypothetical protein
MAISISIILTGAAEVRLTDLNPRWLEHAGVRVAIMFLCPHCASNGDTWLTCFFEPAGDLPRLPADFNIPGLEGASGARLLFHDALKEIGHADPAEGAYHDVVSCNKTCAWKRTNDDFATMSVTPSIDASASGHWHGHITDGEMK